LRKNKLLLCIFIICFIVGFLCINPKTKETKTSDTDDIYTNPYQSSYSSTIEIDNIKETAYDIIFNLDNYQIWYANDNTFHFLFIITPFLFTTESVRIRSNLTEYLFSVSFPLNNAFIKTTFVNNTLELFIRQEIIGNMFIIELKIYTFALNVVPQTASSPSPQIEYIDGDDDGDEKDKGKDIDDAYLSPWGIGLYIVKWWENNPILYWIYPFFVVYILCVVMRTFFRPYVFYKNRKGKIEYIGRFSHDNPSEDLLGWSELYFKGWKKMKLIYSVLSFEGQKRFNCMNFGLFIYFSDLIQHKIKMPEDIVLYEQERVRTVSNNAKYALYRILSFLIPGVLLANKLHKTIEYKKKTEKMDTEIIDISKKAKKLSKKTGKPIYIKEDKLDENGEPILVKIKEIPVIQHQLIFDKINNICDVEYDIKITDEKGETIVHKKKEKKSLFEVSDLKQDKKVSNVKESNYKIDVVPVYDIEEAIMNQNSIDNLKSIYDLKTSREKQAYIELDKKYNLTRDQLDNITRHIKSIIKDKIRELYQKTVVDEDTIIEIVSIALTGYKESGDIQESALQAFREYHERKNIKDLGDYKGKYEIEKTKATLLENQLKKQKPQNPYLLTNESEELEPDFTRD